MRRDRSWAGSFQKIGRALSELMRAEVDELGRDLKASRSKLKRALLFAGASLFLAFWLLAILLYAAVEFAAIWLPRWGAALAVAGVLVLVIAVLLLLFRSVARQLDSPVRTVKRRVEDHFLWWNDTIGPGRDAHGELDRGADDVAER